MHFDLDDLICLGLLSQIGRVACCGHDRWPRSIIPTWHSFQRILVVTIDNFHLVLAWISYWRFFIQHGYFGMPAIRCQEIQVLWSCKAFVWFLRVAIVRKTQRELCLRRLFNSTTIGLQTRAAVCIRFEHFSGRTVNSGGVTESWPIGDRWEGAVSENLLCRWVILRR